MCALYGGSRDISLFRHLNRELMGSIISSQCSFYKYKLEETNTNVYGEASGEKFYMGPVVLNCLVKRQDQTNPETDLGTDFRWDTRFKFLRDDFLDKSKDFNTGVYGANLLPEVGDIIFYQESYYEVHTLISNQLFMGKDPQYPDEINPLNPGLGEYGYNVSIICDTHRIPSDKLNISQQKLI